ncbi:hypothetical protein Ahia01_000003500 [Argonauta hians]
MSQVTTNNSTGYGTQPAYVNHVRHIFTGDERYYEIWEVKFYGLMRLKGLSNILGNLDEEQNNIDNDKNSDLFAELTQSLDDKSLCLIIRDARNNGRKALRILRDHYLPKGKPRVITLYTQLTSMVKNSDETITDYVIRAESIHASLINTGEVVSDGLLTAMVIKGLPREYQAFTTVITQREKPITFQQFKVALRNYEDTEQLQCPANPTEIVTRVMSAKAYPEITSKSQRWCQKCKRNGHDTAFCRRNKTGGRNKWCQICRTHTHNTKFCRKLSRLRETENKDHTKSCRQTTKHQVKTCDTDSENDENNHHFVFGLRTRDDKPDLKIDPHLKKRRPKVKNTCLRDKENVHSSHDSKRKYNRWCTKCRTQTHNTWFCKNRDRKIPGGEYDKILESINILQENLATQKKQMKLLMKSYGKDNSFTF